MTVSYANWGTPPAPEEQQSSARPWVCIRCGAKLSSAMYVSGREPSGPYCLKCWKNGLEKKTEAKP